MQALISNRWAQVIILLALLLAAVLFKISDPKIIERMQHLTFDYYNKLMPRMAGEGVIIIDIDEKSLQHPQLGQWPWSRTKMAKLVENLTKMGAKSITFDMVFAEKDRTSPDAIAHNLPKTESLKGVREQLFQLPDNDNIFADKIKESGIVVTGFVPVAGNQKAWGVPPRHAKIWNDLKARKLSPPGLKNFVPKKEYFTTNLRPLAKASKGNGSFSATPEEDGIIRRVPLLIGMGREEAIDEVRVYPSISLEALRVAMGERGYTITSYLNPTPEGHGIIDIQLGDYKVPVDQNGQIWVYYAGSKQKTYISARDIIFEEVNPTRIKDKIVFIGTSAQGLLDLRSSPLASIVPGVEMHVEIVEQILSGQFLTRPEILKGIELISIIAVSLLVIILSPFIGTGMLAFISISVVGAGILGSLYAYQAYGYLVDPVYSAIVIIFIFTTGAILSNIRTEMEKRSVRQAFSHYISEDLVNELTDTPEKLSLGGEVKELTVMFTDVRNFTTISESLTPDELIRLMNDFLTPMTEEIMNRRGTIDKYMGDAIMAFWNAPLDDDQHVRHACEAALAMMVSLDKLNEELKLRAESENKPYNEVRTGVGLGTGPCSVGNMGSRQRFAYSALGDTVNLASRLESQTKNYGVPILINEQTSKGIKEFAVIELDLLQVKGKTEPERIYALLGDESMAETDAFKKLLESHMKMLKAYRTQNFKEAKNMAKDLQKMDMVQNLGIGALYDVYLSRISGYATNPPPTDWAGIWVAEGK